MAQELFRDDFESGLGRWQVTKPQWLQVADSGDPAHGKVLKMSPGGGTHSYLLIRGSEKWGGVRIEGEVLFPDNADNYLGLMYNYAERDGRVDYTSVYIKGNGSYLQANPRLDGNPMRTILPEYLIPLRGPSAITIGRWQRFRAEIIGTECHFYVGDAAVPNLTFDYPYLRGGPIGFKPRVAGYEVWLDNLTVQAITQFSYSGPPQPQIAYKPEALITEWHAVGPFAGRISQIEEGGYAPGKTYSELGRSYRWEKFATDRRGAMLTSRLVEFMGPRNRAYLHATLRAAEAGDFEIQFSAVDELLIWVNGEFWGFMTPTNAAWHDFWENPEHASPRQIVRMPLKAGDNDLLIMVNGGAYADAGFFARKPVPRKP